MHHQYQEFPTVHIVGEGVQRRGRLYWFTVVFPGGMTARNGKPKPAIEAMNGVEKKQGSINPHPGSLDELDGRSIAPQT